MYHHPHDLQLGARCCMADCNHKCQGSGRRSVASVSCCLEDQLKPCDRCRADPRRARGSSCAASSSLCSSSWASLLGNPLHPRRCHGNLAFPPGPGTGDRYNVYPLRLSVRLSGPSRLCANLRTCIIVEEQEDGQSSFVMVKCVACGKNYTNLSPGQSGGGA